MLMSTSWCRPTRPSTTLFRTAPQGGIATRDAARRGTHRARPPHLSWKQVVCAFTDTFEDLGALEQLPGIGVQRLMADGYGFGAEGDWKAAALVRI